MNSKSLAAGLFGLALALPVSAHAAGFEILVPHRAVYEVALDDSEDRSGIEAMDGRIVYETRGNACEGISINYRFVTRINTGSDTFVTDQQSASHESADGEQFSFHTRSFVNEQPDQKIQGTAQRTSDGIEVKLEGENARELQLPSGIFTSAHLLDVIESAKKGDVFVTHKVFDGSGEADKVLKSASVIGKARIVNEKLEGEGGEGLAELLSTKAWPVTMSYFIDNADNTAEATPIYEASFLLYENGVTRDLTMRYPDYALKATLSEVEFLDRGDCQPGK